MGQPILILNASNESDLDTASASLTEHRAAALLVTNDAFLFNRRDQIVAMATRNAVPAIYDRREYAAAGGLISYGPNYVRPARPWMWMLIVPDAAHEMGSATVGTAAVGLQPHRRQLACRGNFENATENRTGDFPRPRDLGATGIFG